MDVVDEARSRSAGAPATVTVVVSTYRRRAFLPGLLAALAAQRDAPPYEVVVVDNGSPDDTWPVLRALTEDAGIAVRALRLAANAGPGAARNAGARAGTGRLLAFTDDDCLPTPGWLSGLAAAAAPADVVLVQGRTRPAPRSGGGPWDRSVTVSGPTPWFETCNVAYARTAYEAVGGFDEQDALSTRAGGGRPFGEDALLGHRVLARGGRAVFAADAVVEHRWLPGTFADHLRERRHVRGFPDLARRLPAVADACWGGVFLSPRTARVDLAAAAVVAAVTTRRPLLLAGTLPWLRDALGPARARRGRLPVRLAQAAVADTVGLASLVEGSLRARRLVL